MSGRATLRIDTNSAVPVYRQVVDGLRSHLVEGRLKAGDSLPTVRELALELGVHFNTIAEAYRILSAEGWLDVKRRRGVIVTERHSPAPAPEARAHFGEKLRHLVALVRSEGLPVRTITKELEQLVRELSA